MLTSFFFYFFIFLFHLSLELVGEKKQKRTGKNVNKLTKTTWKLVLKDQKFSKKKTPFFLNSEN